MLGLLVVYLIAVAVATVAAGPFAKTWFKNEKAIAIIEVASLLPHWVGVMIHAPFIAIYAVASTYVLVEGFVDLRIMLGSAFRTIDWWAFATLLNRVYLKLLRSFVCKSSIPIWIKLLSLLKPPPRLNTVSYLLKLLCDLNRHPRLLFPTQPLPLPLKLPRRFTLIHHIRSQ